MGLFRFVNHAGEVALQNDFFGEIMANLIFFIQKENGAQSFFAVKSILPLVLSWKKSPSLLEINVLSPIF